MDTNDFLGSFAQENVSFTTKVVKTASAGDNFWKAMIFVENSRFVNTTTADWTAVPGSTVAKALTVTSSDYAEYTSGLLRSWLYDLFCNGFTGDCILVACGDNLTDETGSDTFIKNMEETYDLLKAYAYHKTCCVCTGEGADQTSVVPAVAVSLASKCADDKNLLSSAPYFPYSTSTPTQADSDPLYTAIKTSGKDAFFSAHQDATRNAALYSLGLAMSTLNGSGTCVGNSFDMVKSSMITSSGAGGTNLSKGVRSALKNLNIQTFKPVGDNSGNVAAIGANTLNGDVVQANWIIAYITYMTKVAVAQLITSNNFLKNESNYATIVTVMGSYLTLFGPNGSGRLGELSITAPEFSSLPTASGDEIIIPDAWSATYVDQVREVQITGTLYIGA